MTVDGRTPRRQVVGAAIVRGHGDDLRLLAARRTEPPLLAGFWELPGGKVEPGEELRDALRREVEEELGLAVVAEEEVAGPLDGDWPLGADYALRVFVVRLADDEEPEPREQHDLLRWLAPHEWDSVDWLPDDVGPVRAALAQLGED